MAGLVGGDVLVWILTCCDGRTSFRPWNLLRRLHFGDLLDIERFSLTLSRPLLFGIRADTEKFGQMVSSIIQNDVNTRVTASQTGLKTKYKSFNMVLNENKGHHNNGLCKMHGMVI